MPERPLKLPKYRHYRPKNLGVVRIDGRDFYLGAYNSAASWEKYRRLVAEWLTARRVDPTATPARAPEPPPLTVDEVVLAFWRHAEKYYRTPEGQPSAELDNVRDALRPLRRVYGQTPAREFGPLALRAVRTEMVRAGLARTTVNARVNRVRRVFKWAASVELIPASVVEKLRTVEGLKRGRSEARDVEDVVPVPVEHVEATLPHLPPAVAAMVRLQLLTGCRAGEVMAMRGCYLTPGEPTWEYRPSHHKTAWRGKDRVIPLGPRAVAALKPLLRPDPTAFLFSPRETVTGHHAGRTAARRSRPTPSELEKRRRTKGGQGHAPRYNRRTYRQAVIRACDRAGVPRWSPLQLRHTAATAIRARYGLEAAQAVLGHAKPDTTLIYAESDAAKVRKIMAEFG
jgi:integrase